MRDAAVLRNLSLPKEWLARVRSWMVQAISLAHLSLTFARWIPANRIKDAGMERIPAQRRPHYPPTERLAIIELRARGWSASQTAERLLVSCRLAEFRRELAAFMSRCNTERPRSGLDSRTPDEV